VLKNRGFSFLEILFSWNYGEFRDYDILVGNNFLYPNQYFGFHSVQTLTEKNRKYKWPDNFGGHCTFSMFHTAPCRIDPREIKGSGALDPKSICRNFFKETITILYQMKDLVETNIVGDRTSNCFMV
jgi:hypothetical protein